MFSLIFLILWWRERARRRELEESYRGMWDWNRFLQAQNDSWMQYHAHIGQRLDEMDDNLERAEEHARLKNQLSYLLLHMAQPTFSMDTAEPIGPPPWIGNEEET